MLKPLKNIVLSIIILVCTAGVSPAYNVMVKGRAVDYKSYSLSFYIYEDLITKSERKIGECLTDTSGFFTTSLTIPSTCQVFCYLGVYKAFFYAEPGREYLLVLPPRRDKGLVEDLNPYFEPEEMSLGIGNADSTELNYAIMQFNMLYEPFISKHFTYLYYTSDVNRVDSLKNHVQDVFRHVETPFFKDYVSYKLAFLYHLTYERDKSFATRKYFADKPVLYQNPAYMDFFNQLWGKYFTDQAVTEPVGDVLKSNIVYSKSPYELRKTLDENPVLRNPVFKDLVILKGLSDCLTRPDDFLTNPVIQTIDSMNRQATIVEMKTIAGNLLKLSKKLKASDITPDFCLPDQKDTMVCLNSFRGKFVYLVFGRSENYACLKDYMLLADIHKSRLPGLEIVLVSCDQDKATFVDYVKRNTQYSWIFLYDKDKVVTSLFEQKVLPGYVLIDPDGRIAMFPAASPHENFKGLYPQIRVWRQRALNAKKK